jgi:UDP-glucose 4-epimerase
VGTVCDVLLDTVLRRLSHPEPVNVAFNTETSLLELVAALEAASEVRTKVEFRPPRTADIRYSRADDSQLRRLFPHLAPVPLIQGLRDTLDWARDRRGLQPGSIG